MESTFYIRRVPTAAAMPGTYLVMYGREEHIALRLRIPKDDLFNLKCCDDPHQCEENLYNRMFDLQSRLETEEQVHHNMQVIHLRNKKPTPNSVPALPTVHALLVGPFNENKRHEIRDILAYHGRKVGLYAGHLVIWNSG